VGLFDKGHVPAMIGQRIGKRVAALAGVDHDRIKGHS
jgi:hypothetical protein